MANEFIGSQGGWTYNKCEKISDGSSTVNEWQVKPSDSGKIYFLDLGSGGRIQALLPKLSSVSAGWKVKFVVQTTSTGQNFHCTGFDLNKDGTPRSANADNDSMYKTEFASSDAGGGVSVLLDGCAFSSGGVGNPAKKGDYIEVTTNGTYWYVKIICEDAAHASNISGGTTIDNTQNGTLPTIAPLGASVTWNYQRVETLATDTTDAMDGTQTADRIELTEKDSGIVFYIEPPTGGGNKGLCWLPKLSDVKAGWHARFIASIDDSGAYEINAYGVARGGTTDTSVDGDNDVASITEMAVTDAGSNTLLGKDGIKFNVSNIAGDLVDVMTDGTSWYMWSLAADAAHFSAVQG